MKKGKGGAARTARYRETLMTMGKAEANSKGCTLNGRGCESALSEPRTIERKQHKGKREVWVSQFSRYGTRNQPSAGHAAAAKEELGGRNHWKKGCVAKPPKGTSGKNKVWVIHQQKHADLPRANGRGEN